MRVFWLAIFLYLANLIVLYIALWVYRLLLRPLGLGL